MLSIIKLSILSKSMGAMDEIFNNEKHVVLFLKGYISIQLSILIQKEAGLHCSSLSVSFSAVLFVSKSTYEKLI